MKNIKTTLLRFLYNIWYFRKIKKFNGYNRALRGAVHDKTIDQIILKHKIVRYMRRYLKVDAKSKFIPWDHKSNEESRQQVLGKFGEQMAALDITINHKLELCTP